MMTGWDCLWPLYRAKVESRALFGIRQNWKGIPRSIYLFSPQKLHEMAGEVRVQSCCWQDFREPSRLRRIHSHVTLSPLILTAATARWGRQLFLDFSFILFHFSLPLPIQRWTHWKRKMKTIPFCPMSHHPPQLVSKKPCKWGKKSYFYDLTPVSESDRKWAHTFQEPT